MNFPSPKTMSRKSSVRLTSAGWMAVATLLSTLSVPCYYAANWPFAYLGSLVLTMILGIYTAEMAMRHRSKR